MRQIVRLAIVVLATFATGTASAQQLTENFDDISVLPGAGWGFINNSNPAGTTSWFQGNAAVFAAHGGAATSYLAANFNAADFGGNISLWAITPQLTNLQNDEVLTFYTRTESSAPAADRLEVRLCLGACGTDVGSSDSSVGIFTMLLLVINPALATAGYPTGWTQFSIILSGLPLGPNQGRFAFRYFVPDTSINGDYIGLDTLNLTDPPPVDLAISKTVNNPTPGLGDTVTFTVTVTNNDTRPATNVIVSDRLPAGLLFLSATPSQGVYASGTGMWTVGTVAAASSQTLVIQAKVISPNPQKNTATISHADQPDLDSSNNARTLAVNASKPVPLLGIVATALLLSFLALVGFLTLRRSVV